MILITGKMTDEGLKLLKGFDVKYLPNIKGKDLEENLKDAQALIIRTETEITRDLLKFAKNLKLICRSGVGVDHIDLKACAEKNIIVINTPGANRISAAEHTLGLILSLARMIPQATVKLKAGGWNRDEFTGVEISKKTLGIIGLGNIGQMVASRAKAFNMNVIAYDPYLDPSIAKGVEVALLKLDEVLSKSDFVTMHVPLTDKTRAMANKDFFKKMKPHSFFINTSRGQVYVEDDLLNALNSGHIRGAALDVFKNEPLEKGNPLLASEKTILTPHTAGQTKESQENMSLEAAVQVKTYIEKGIILNPIKIEE